MSTFQERLEQNNKPHKPSRRLLTFDDTELNEEDKSRNIFEPEQPQNTEREEHIIIAQNKGERKAREESSKSRTQLGREQKQKSNPATLPSKHAIKLPPLKPREPESMIQILDTEQVAPAAQVLDEEVHGVSKKSELSVWQSINLALGHFFYSYSFPLKREIPIIINYQDMEREKYENGTYISQAFDNDLSISLVLFLLKAVVWDGLARIHVALWLAAVVLAYAVSPGEQYAPGKQILLGIFLLSLAVQGLLRFISVKKRRDWQQNSGATNFRVYNYDLEHKSAEWVLTPGSKLRPGNIYKIPLSETTIVPADSILLHSPRTIIQASESKIIECLTPLERHEKITLKQALVKSQVIMLPLTGVMHYELAAPEILHANIEGCFVLQEPVQARFDISYDNILLRGSQVLSSETLMDGQHEPLSSQADPEMLAVVLETGIDSLVLKTCQYPFQYKRAYPYLQKIDKLLAALSLLYLVVVGAGVLIGYIYTQGATISRGYYIDDFTPAAANSVSLSELTMHHFANLVMVVPILLKLIYVFYINVMASRLEAQLQVHIKDAHLLADIKECNTLVTTLGGDLIRMGDGQPSKPGKQDPDANLTVEEGRALILHRNLRSIRVGSTHHNFLTTTINSEEYSAQTVDTLMYFMSIALLTCNSRNATPLERGIVERCHKELNLRVEAYGRGSQKTLKIGTLRVSKILTLLPTEAYPYKIVFYRHAKEVVEDIAEDGRNLKMDNSRSDKILCLVRGETSRLNSRMSQADQVLLSDFSVKMHQEKGFHVELLAKFVLAHEQFEQIRKMYLGADVNQGGPFQNAQGNRNYRYSINRFYEFLQTSMMNLDPLGLLIWENPYSLLPNNLSPLSTLAHLQYKIIVAPASKSLSNPEFESIHTITNYLLRTSGLPLQEISDRIVHSYEGRDAFWQVLSEHKTVVLNGWESTTLRRMLAQLRELGAGLLTLGYVEQDEYAWLLKEVDVAVGAEGDGYDLEKYTDLLMKKDKTLATKQVLQSLVTHSQVYSQCLDSIVVVQFNKAVMLGCVEFINCFYTWGTGLVLIGSPLYLLLEIGLALDFLYYLFPAIKLSTIQATNKPGKTSKDSLKKKPESVLSVRNLALQFGIAASVGLLVTLVAIYSSIEPGSSEGVTQPKQFTHILVHFALYHSLIFAKIFLPPHSVSLLKVIVLTVQIGIYYLGLLIISAADAGVYQGVIWYVLSGRTILAGLALVWVVVTGYWVGFMMGRLHQQGWGFGAKYNKIFADEADEKQEMKGIKDAANEATNKKWSDRDVEIVGTPVHID